MYVADVTDMAELRELLAEIEDRLLANPNNEVAQWDKEDVLNRMAEIS